MQFTQLRVSGFKSFSDPVELLIETGLTGVVGPNGCGKSNVVEALRWVMGESSARGLRGVEMDDVIFNGSAFRAAFDLAEVKLRLRGPVPGLPELENAEEIEVVRRIGRGAGSAYRINGREARARDVQLLFADAAAGARSAAIVGQGQIGLLVDARPDERRRLLEEAAGIGGLHSRRREAELKLETTAANLARVLDRLAQQRERLASLEAQAAEAQKYRRMSGRLRALELHLAGLRAAGLAHALSSAAERLDALERSIAKDDGVSATRAQRRAELEFELEAVRATERARATDAARATERLEAGHETARRLQAERDEAARQLEEARADSGEAQRRLQALDTGLAELALTLEELAERATAVSLELSAGESASEDARAALAAAEEEARSAIAQRAAAEAEESAAAARSSELATVTTGLVQALNDLPAGVDDDELTRDRVRSAELEAELAALTAERVTLREQDQATEGSAVVAARELAAAEADRATAREALLAAQARADAAAERGRARESRRQALARALARCEERIATAAEAAAGAVNRLTGLDLDRLAAAVAASTADRDRGAAALTAARAANAAAGADLAAADVAERAARSEHERLVTEAQALQSILPELPGAPLADRLRLEPTHARALAAALGDDLLGDAEGQGAVHWRRLAGEATADPPLPAGVVPLAGLIDGGPLLRRRLAQTGIVGAERAAELQARLTPGQRLVSLDGDLWRWDGFVRLAASGEIAARLRNRQRLEALGPELARAKAAVIAARAAREAAESEVAAAAARMSAAEATREGARARSLAVEATLANAQVAAESAREALARAAAEQAAAESERLELATELAAVAAEARASGPSGEHEAEASARTAVAAAEERLAEARRAAARLAEEGRHVRTRLQAIEDRGERLRQERDSLVQAVASRAERLGVRRAELEAERQRLTAGLAATEAEAGAAAAELARRAGAAVAARQRAQDAERRLHQARLAHESAMGTRAGAAAEHARLADRRELLARDRVRLEAERDEAKARAGAMAERTARLAERLGSMPPADEANLALLAARQASAMGELAAAEDAVLRQAAALAEEEAALSALERGLAQARADHARAEAEAAALGHQAAAAVAARTSAQSACQPGDAELLEQGDLAADCASLEARLARLRAARDRLGAVNLRAAIELEELGRELDETRSQEAEVRAAVDRLHRALATLNGEARARLRNAFAEVEAHFHRLFVQLFGGGRAHLRLTNLDDPLAAGLELEAMPPGKKLTHVSLLSGGEKSLTGLALVFAFFLSRPAPLCVLDEVDAPLDDANVERCVELMAEIASVTGTRFLVVTHHPLTMARMDRLYGVTMVEKGVSRVVSVALEEAVQLREAG